MCSRDRESVHRTGHGSSFGVFSLSLGLWATDLACLWLSHRNKAAGGIGLPPERPFPTAEKFGHPQIRLLLSSRGHRPPSPPAFFSPHPYNPIPSLPGSVPPPLSTPSEGRGRKPLRVALRGNQRRPRLLTPLPFLSYLPSFPGSRRTPDLVSAQAHQNSPARLPRSCYPGDRANSDQSARVGRGFSGAFRGEMGRVGGHVVEAGLRPWKLGVAGEGGGVWSTSCLRSDWVRANPGGGLCGRKGSCAI